MGCNKEFFFFFFICFFFQAEDGIRDIGVTGVQTCALPISGNYTLYDLRRMFYKIGILINKERGTRRWSAAVVHDSRVFFCSLYFPCK